MIRGGGYNVQFKIVLSTSSVYKFDVIDSKQKGKGGKEE